MFGFLLGMVVGALGFWYLSRARAGRPTVEGGTRVQRPTGPEVHGRPSEPLPAERPPSGEIEHPIGLGQKG